MNWFDIFVQLIGCAGLLCAVIAFQCKAHKRVMLFRTLNELFFAAQYLLLGSYTGTAMNVIGSARNIVFAGLVEKGRSTTAFRIIFSVIFTVIGLITSEGLVSILVIGAKVVTTVAYGMKNTKYIRILTLPTSMCWLIYNIGCSSWAGVLCEVFTICSIISAIIRIDVLKK